MLDIIGIVKHIHNINNTLYLRQLPLLSSFLVALTWECYTLFWKDDVLSVVVVSFEIPLVHIYLFASVGGEFHAGTK